jgi:hypothetical protein
VSFHSCLRVRGEGGRPENLCPRLDGVR